MYVIWYAHKIDLSKIAKDDFYHSQKYINSDCIKFNLYTF